MIYAYLHSHFALEQDDCEEIFQDSLVILWQNIQDEKIIDVASTMSTSTYFLTICRNKAFELLKSKGKFTTESLDSGDTERVHILESKIEMLLAMDNDDEQRRNSKLQIVRTIVSDLPSPCNELLWGVYRDGYSMKYLAQKFGYASENAVKVIKHRCCEKFAKRFKEVIKAI